MKWLMVTFFSIFLLACEPVTSYEPEVRPDNVSDSAIWVGGPDGGVYAVVRLSNNKYSGTVYYESGDIWYEGSFVYSGKEFFDVDDKTIYSAWDGDILYLVNGHQLIATNAD